jgi:hypothetical protein
MHPSTEPDRVVDPKAEARDHPVLVTALAVAIALTLAVFVYLWAAAGLPSSAWLLPLGWVPLMVWNYLLLRSGQIMGLFLTIVLSFGLFFVTLFAVYSQAGETAILVVRMTGFVTFAALLTAGAYMFGLAARSEE